MTWLDVSAALIIVWVFLIVVLLTDWLVSVFTYNKHE